ncbi:hypothetical protein, partial [Actinomyces provencensis]|uniref:hypothetical protein n=1 Tax=Actinomyces provencensis TaxID=1720198 RepID=UPI001E584B3F
MRTLRRLLLALVVVVLLLVVADRTTDHFLESGIEDSLAATPGVVASAPAPGSDTSGGTAPGATTTGDGGDGPADGSGVSGELAVRVEGIPVLTQLLAG